MIKGCLCHFNHLFEICFYKSSRRRRRGGGGWKNQMLFSSGKRKAAVCDVGRQHPSSVYCIEVYWGKYAIWKLSKLHPIPSQDLFQLSSGSRWIRGINPKNSTKVPSGAPGYLLVVLFLTIRLKWDTKWAFWDFFSVSKSDTLIRFKVTFNV